MILKNKINRNKIIVIRLWSCFDISIYQVFLMKQNISSLMLSNYCSEETTQSNVKTESEFHYIL